MNILNLFFIARCSTIFASELPESHVGIDQLKKKNFNFKCYLMYNIYNAINYGFEDVRTSTQVVYFVNYM